MDNWKIIKGFIRNHTFDKKEEDIFIEEFKKLIKKSNIFTFYVWLTNSFGNTENEFFNKIANIHLEYINQNRLIKTKEYFDSLSETKTIIKNDIIDLLFSKEFKTDAEDYVKKYPITNKQIIDYLKRNAFLENSEVIVPCLNIIVNGTTDLDIKEDLKKFLIKNHVYENAKDEM